MENPSRVPVPLRIRLRFGRAAVQVVADAVGVDVLHIKGNAADPALRPIESSGTDVDILVRPHMSRLSMVHCVPRLAALQHVRLRIPLRACTDLSPRFVGYLDLHRWFPGIRADPEVAFQRMWTDRRTVSFADVGCEVPDIAAQAALLVLNSARGAGDDADLARVGRMPRRTTGIRSRSSSVTGRPGGLRRCEGELERWKGARDYRLWKVISEGGPARPNGGRGSGARRRGAKP